MSSTNGHGRFGAVLYARVSTDEQARSGYSLAQQLVALRDHAALEGYEVLEEITDPGQSGASLERPGMDRVRDLVAAGEVSVVLAQDRGRFAREPAYHYLLKMEFEEHGTKIRALNDRGDGSPERDLTDGILDQLGKYERAKIAERSRRGKLRKAREGKVMAGHRVKYGFKLNAARDGLLVDEEKMRVDRRIFRMVGGEGLPLNAVYRAFERERIPTPGGGKRWDRSFFRLAILDDAYGPHTCSEVAEVVSPEVAARLEPDQLYGLWTFNRLHTRTRRVSESAEDGGRRYRTQVRTREGSVDERIFVPVPYAGVPRELVDAARGDPGQPQAIYRGAALLGALRRHLAVRGVRRRHGDAEHQGEVGGPSPPLLQLPPAPQARRRILRPPPQPPRRRRRGRRVGHRLLTPARPGAPADRPGGDDRGRAGSRSRRPGDGSKGVA
jgi:site-specific DNA recombinase